MSVIWKLWRYSQITGFIGFRVVWEKAILWINLEIKHQFIILELEMELDNQIRISCWLFQNFVSFSWKMTNFDKRVLILTFDRSERDWLRNCYIKVAYVLRTQFHIFSIMLAWCRSGAFIVNF